MICAEKGRLLSLCVVSDLGGGEVGESARAKGEVFYQREKKKVFLSSEATARSRNKAKQTRLTAIQVEAPFLVPTRFPSPRFALRLLLQILRAYLVGIGTQRASIADRCGPRHEAFRIIAVVVAEAGGV